MAEDEMVGWHHRLDGHGFELALGEVIDISPGNLDSSLCFFQSSISHDVLCIKLNKQGEIYSLDVLLLLFGTSLLFHVQF